jgi:hypothetical protein
MATRVGLRRMLPRRQEQKRYVAIVSIFLGPTNQEGLAFNVRFQFLTGSAEAINTQLYHVARLKVHGWVEA